VSGYYRPHLPRITQPIAVISDEGGASPRSTTFRQQAERDLDGEKTLGSDVCLPSSTSTAASTTNMAPASLFSAQATKVPNYSAISDCFRLGRHEGTKRYYTCGESLDSPIQFSSRESDRLSQTVSVPLSDSYVLYPASHHFISKSTRSCYDLHLAQIREGLVRLRQSVWQDAKAWGVVQRRFVELALLDESTLSL